MPLRETRPPNAAGFPCSILLLYLILSLKLIIIKIIVTSKFAQTYVCAPQDLSFYSVCLTRETCEFQVSARL